VVIDSDRTDAEQSLNATKDRVLEALNQAGPRAGSWVTAGYTVENYVPRSRLHAAIGEVHPKAGPTWDGSLYVNPLGAAQLENRAGDADKAAVARVVVRDWDTRADWPLDLGDRVEGLAQMIRQANDLA
jgi:hypothetical protein